jgi:hypothetical protein
MKTEIWVSFNYGGWSLVYSKIIELPFPPFIGLDIIFNDEKGYSVTLNDNDYCSTIISYNLEKQQFEIDVRNVWKQPVTDETVDMVIEEYSDWEKRHSTNIDDLKELMLQNYKNKY